MKAEDLMIGDWVSARCPDFDMSQDFHFLKYDGSNELFNKGYIIEPIPITEEFLENNGFVLILKRSSGEFKGFKQYGSKDGRITIDTMSNTFGKDWYCHIDNEEFETIGGADVQYIHELQHLFKLCGINKEIEEL